MNRKNVCSEVHFPENWMVLSKEFFVKTLHLVCEIKPSFIRPCTWRKPNQSSIQFSFLWLNFKNWIARTCATFTTTKTVPCSVSQFRNVWQNDQNVNTSYMNAMVPFLSLWIFSVFRIIPSIFIRTHLLLRGRFFSRSHPILPRPREQYKPLWIDLDLLPMRLFFLVIYGNNHRSNRRIGWISCFLLGLLRIQSMSTAIALSCFKLSKEL